jgi:SecD/SecF fusion protein
MVSSTRAIAGVGLVLVVLLTGCGSTAGSSKPATARADSGDATELTYAVLPYGSPVTAKKVNAAVALLAQRLQVDGPRVSVRSEGDRIVVTGLQQRTPPIVDTPQLYFYDWETNVVGPSGRPAPTEATVTGGSEAGSAKFGLTEYQAVLRAAKRRPELRVNDTTWQQGCGPRQAGGCLYGGWYLLDTAHQKMVCPAGASQCGPAPTRHSLLATTKAVGSVKIVRVEPGTILAKARPLESASGQVLDTLPNSYYVIRDDPALSGADITNPFEASGAGPPTVDFGFTGHGRTTFEKVTKEIAHRGQEAQLPGVSKEAALQHFAVLLNGQLLTVPSIDFTRYPEGIDASGGSEISGGFEAKKLTEEVQRASDLPVRLTLLKESVAATIG